MQSFIQFKQMNAILVYSILTRPFHLTCYSSFFFSYFRGQTIWLRPANWVQTSNTIEKYCCIFSWLTYVPVRGPAYPVRAHLISSYRVASLIPCIEALSSSVSKFAQSAERLLNDVAPSIKFIDFKTEKLEDRFKLFRYRWTSIIRTRWDHTK